MKTLSTYMLLTGVILTFVFAKPAHAVNRQIIANPELLIGVVIKDIPGGVGEWHSEIEGWQRIIEHAGFNKYLSRWIYTGIYGGSYSLGTSDKGEYLHALMLRDAYPVMEAYRIDYD